MLKSYNVVSAPIAAGVATIVSPAIAGRLLTFVIKYSGTPAGTIAATAKHGSLSGTVDEAILSAVTATNRSYQPRKQAQDTAGANIAAVFGEFTVNGVIQFDIAGAAAANGQTVAITLHVDD